MESPRSVLCCCCCSYLFLLALLHYGSGSSTIPSGTPILHRNSSNHGSDKTCLSLCKEKQQLNACISHCEQQLQDSKIENRNQQLRLKKALTKRQASEVEVVCVPVWNPSTHQYTVGITWTLSTEFQLQWVKEFRIERRKDHLGSFYFLEISRLFHLQPNTYSYMWLDTGLVPYKNIESNPLRVYYILRVLLTQSYPGNDDRIDRTCLLDISPPPPRAVVNLTTTVEDIVWLNLGAVITGVSARWSLPLNTTASTDLAALKYQCDIGDNTSSHSNPLEFSQNSSMVWNISSHTVYGGGNPRDIFIWVRTYYSTTVRNTANSAIHNDIETINVYSNWSDPVLLEAPLRSSTPLLSTTPVAPSSSIAVQTTTPVQQSLVSSTAVVLLPSLGMTAPIQAQSIIIISVSTVFGALLLLAVCTIVMVCVVLGIKRRQLDIFKNGSNREEWLPVFNRNESLISSNSVDGPCSDRWEVSAHDVTIHEKLGEGEFGEVFKGEIYSDPSKGQCGLPQQQVAVKLLKKHATGTEKSDFLKEIDLMKKIAEGNNPHVVNMMGCVTIREPLVLITEFVEYGDLHSYLTSCRKQMQLETPPEKAMHKEEMNGLKTGEIRTIESWDLFSFAYQIASGMEYLASLSVVHRDLACRNILIGHKKCLKITDFGMSRMLNNHGAYVKTQTARLPLKWMAIESILNREFTTASDVWSFGVTLWEICTLGGFPYAIIDNDDLVTLLRQGHRLDKPDSCPTEMYEMMLRCWAELPQDRPSFVELHKIFDKMLSKQKDAPLYVELCEQDQQPSSTQVVVVSTPAACSVPSLVEPSTSQRSVATIGSGVEGDTEQLKGAVNPYVTSPTQAVSYEHLRPSYLGLPRQSHESVHPLTSPSQFTPNTGSIRLTELFKNQPRSVSNSHIPFI